MSKILYAASTYGHIKAFHLDYIAALKSEGHEVKTLAAGEGADYNIPFEKRMLSLANLRCRAEIARIVNEGGFDAIIVNTTLAAFHIRLALGKKRPRLLNVVHGYLFSENSNLFKKSALLFCEWMLRKRTDAILVMNEEDERIARKYSLAKSIDCIRGMGVKDVPATRSRE